MANTEVTFVKDELTRKTSIRVTFKINERTAQVIQSTDMPNLKVERKKVFYPE